MKDLVQQLRYQHHPIIDHEPDFESPVKILPDLPGAQSRPSAAQYRNYKLKRAVRPVPDLRYGNRTSYRVVV